MGQWLEHLLSNQGAFNTCHWHLQKLGKFLTPNVPLSTQQYNWVPGGTRNDSWLCFSSRWICTAFSPGRWDCTRVSSYTRGCTCKVIEPTGILTINTHLHFIFILCSMHMYLSMHVYFTLIGNISCSSVILKLALF